ncbi:hypothetical protein TRIATDRAFT_301588 [Trichoderma atroviride IMI 206040]|uniref:Uncharacterized protein n=1 Tax=Hypocrea atroviridis (strain ATCC 20476 / IMI 206040) TaxID=452589 RepID=G9P7J6_HYPAI|nr:uncharacterized protein TRIATDRAFT_301588 [Trichoderma atroviride IMI 206040]EHK40806.1 hypothetical protein TRIATDRAFT_301588 [Trichoderma atroviride IMI 206040]
MPWAISTIDEMPRGCLAKGRAHNAIYVYQTAAALNNRNQLYVCTFYNLQNYLPDIAHDCGTLNRSDCEQTIQTLEP